MGEDDPLITNDGTRLVLFAEDGTDGYECPVCGRAFDQDEWEKTSVGGSPWGGQATHECPTDDCEGTASVNF